MSRQSPPPFLRALRRLRATFWWRRIVHWLFRATWLALLVPTIFMTGYLCWGWSPGWYYWVCLMLLVGLLSLLWSMRPIRLKKMTHRLDDRLGLRAQLITAFEVSQSADNPAYPENLVVLRLLQETVNIIVRLRRRVRIANHSLWLEMQALIGVAALLTALLMLDALSPRLPEAPPVELPPAGREPAADEVIPPNPQLFPPPSSEQSASVQMQGMSDLQLLRALQAMAEVMRDQATTRAVAEAIDRGDLSSAAEGMRRLADQLSDLSEEARAELGDTLQKAADRIGDDGDDAPNLTEPLLAGSEALSQDDLPGASQALEELAEALDAIEESPQETAQVQPEASGDLAGLEQSETEESQDSPAPEQDLPGEQAGAPLGGAGAGDGTGDGPNQPPEEERLAIEGQPLELESDPELVEDRVLQPAELDAPAGAERTEDSPFARQSIDETTELGADPLTYPWEKREIIRRYFTPN